MHFTNFLRSGLLKPPFRNHSTKVILSENQTKNQGWNQNGGGDLADESESRAVTHQVSTCVGARCFGTAQTIMFTAPSWTIVEIQWHRKSERIKYGSNCIARTEKQYFWCPSDWIGADEMGLNAVWQLHRARWRFGSKEAFCYAPFVFVILIFQI